VRVVVTGGTGFVGSHTVAALIRHGHDVRVMARRPETVAGVLGPLGASAETVPGDVTDPSAVAAALDGCDAVVHAAAHVGVSTGGGPSHDVNVDGTRHVLTRAVRLGMDPIVYTSSVSIYLPSALAVITPDSPLAEPLSPYTASKREAELLVREFQAEGHPVTSVAIGGVYGPHSPHLDSSFAGVLGALRSMMLVPPGGIGVVDVRDAAELLARAARPGRGPRRYLAGGTYVTWSEWVDLMSAGAGTEVARHEVTADEMIALGRDVDDQRRNGVTVDIPLTEEAAIVMTSCPPTDDSATLADLGMSYRPVVETFRDTVEFLRREGHLPPAD
jgi:nucleoside-diphosphate-sugar epimerase